MATCQKCGAQIPDGATTCPACGAPVGNDVNAKIQQLNNTADYTSQMDPADIEQNKVFAILSYFWILWLIPLLAAKESKFARFHANQGLVLFIASIICGIVPILGWLLSIVVLVFAIMGIVSAVQGQAKDLPLIGKIKLIK